MKKNILLITFLVIQNLFSQQKKEAFIGEIHATYQKVFNDKEAYLEDVERYLDISDSLMTIRFKTNPFDKYTSQYSTLEACLNDNRVLNKIRLNPDFVGQDWRIQKSRRLVFTDSTIYIYDSYGKPTLLNRSKGIYTNRYRYNGNGAEQEQIKHRFTDNSHQSIEIDSSDFKNIAGIKCFKVTAIYNDERFEKIKKLDHKVIYEMYVTNEIKTKFHPFFNSLSVLNKFYPLYVKRYSTAFKGYYIEQKVVTVARENELDSEKLKVSYNKLKDSLLYVYKGIVSIDKIKNKNLAPIFQQIKKIPVPFETQLEVFEKLGYKLNSKVNLKDIERELVTNGMIDTSKMKMEKYFETNPYNSLYYFMGWTKYDKLNKKLIRYTDKCIWYDLEFIDPSSEYITLMKRMGEISDGELSFTDISLSIGKDNYEWISFKVNGIEKKWKLQKVRYIADSFFTRFSHLTSELKTNGRYTYFDNGSQQFVIDYATPSEQKEFIKKTGLQREWLTGGKHFSEPKD